MKVGDLVYELSDWVADNRWMTGSMLDNTDKTKLGIVINIGSKGQLARVHWFHSETDTVVSVGKLAEFIPDKK
tara:strand:- start:529 stop:747 length:219 start_codon:yes stop_codon:yes gene_type:complete